MKAREFAIFLLVGLALAGLGMGSSAPQISERATAAEVPSKHLLSSSPNVVLITLDGVRWDEVFEGSDPDLTGAPSHVVMPHLVGDLAREGVLLGDRKSSWVDVANPVNMSLPGYQSIFAGHPTSCRTNFCPPTRSVTFPERLQSVFGFTVDQMAGFASWEQVDRAYARPGARVYFNSGVSPSGLEDSHHPEIDAAQVRELPPWDRPGVWRSRYDRFTFAHGLDYLKTRRPRFLYIGLLDSDEQAHAGNYPGYLQALRQSDAWIREVATTLDSMGDYGRNTLLIVTTDHGRGRGRRWNTHGYFYRHSHHIWMYLRGPGVTPGQSPIPGSYFSHDAIRVLVERTFGI